LVELELLELVFGLPWNSPTFQIHLKQIRMVLQAVCFFEVIFVSLHEKKSELFATDYLTNARFLNLNFIILLAYNKSNGFSIDFSFK
jgi:hypothetical protein